MRRAAARRIARAVESAGEGRDDQARVDADAAVNNAPRDTVILLLAARLHAALGDAPAAVELYDRALAVEPRSSVLLSEKYQLCAHLSRDREAVMLAERVLTLLPERGDIAESAASLYASRWCWAEALVLADRAARSRPGARIERMRADLLAHLGRIEDARSGLARAIEISPTAACLVSVAEIEIRDGSLEAAVRHLDHAITYPDDEGLRARVRRAELRLWAMDLEGAARDLEAIEALDPSCAAAARIRGAIVLFERRFEQAIHTLDEALGLDPRDHEALVFRAEAKLRLGHAEAAIADIDASRSLTDSFPFPALLVRALARVSRGRRIVCASHPDDELREVLTVLCPEEVHLLDDARPTVAGPILERALACLGGNRTPIVTRQVGGTVTRVRVRSGARQDVRQAIEGIRVRAPVDVERAVDAIVAAYPDSPLPRCYRGELRLWLGRYRDARADLEESLKQSRFTRWSYVGLTAVEMLEGNPVAALEVSARGVSVMGSVGNSVYVYRGEAYRRLGRLDEARSDLEQACRLHSNRISAFINLALLEAAAGRPDSQARRFDELLPDAAGLLSDAARELGLAPVRTAEGHPHETITRILDRGLQMMRGNRSSSCPTYFTATGELRVVKAGTPIMGREAQLGRIKALLARV